MDMHPQTIIDLHQTGNAEWCYRRHSVLHSFSRPFHVCHMCSGSPWYSIANSHQAPTCWAVSTGNTRVSLSGHPRVVCFWLFGQYIHTSGLLEVILYIWQCSSCFSLHKGRTVGKATLFHNDISWQVNGFNPCGYESCYDFIFKSLCQLCWCRINITENSVGLVEAS